MLYLNGFIISMIALYIAYTPSIDAKWRGVIQGLIFIIILNKDFIVSKLWYKPKIKIRNKPHLNAESTKVYISLLMNPIGKTSLNIDGFWIANGSINKMVYSEENSELIDIRDPNRFGFVLSRPTIVSLWMEAYPNKKLSNYISIYYRCDGNNKYIKVTLTKTS